MRCIILLSVACLALPEFSTLSHKRYDFQGKGLLHLKSVFFSVFSTTFVWNVFSFQEEFSDILYIIINVQSLHVKYPIFLSDFNETWISSIHFREMFKYHLYRCTVHFVQTFNRLRPNDPYMGRTVPLTSKRSILYIYSTNIGTEYFKHALYSPFFFFKMQFVS